MEKFIPYEKLSKREQQKINKARRGTWGEINPVTRKPKNSKAYSRKRAQAWKKDLPDLRSAFFALKASPVIDYNSWEVYSMNNYDFPGDLHVRPVALPDLAADNQAIGTIYAFAKTIDNPYVQNALYSCLRLACDALCAECDQMNLDPDVLDYWDGESEMIVTPFDPMA